MQKVHTTEDPFLANILKAELENNGIEVVIMDKRDRSYNTFGFLEIYVPDPNFEDALKLIQETMSEEEE